MQEQLLQEAERYTRQNRRRRIWRKLVQAMACAVVFCTTYALILPAITLEKTQCGLEEHVHCDSCYEKVIPEPVVSLACSYESLGVHTHAAQCYDSDGSLLCGCADFLVHEHGEDCRDSSGALVCGLPEILEHEHTDACYFWPSVHVHEDACYSTVRGDLLCQLEEKEGHTHEDACFTRGELICQQEEQEAHIHGEGCRETLLVCDLTVEPHVHTDACYQQLICEIPEGEEHTHSEACSGTVLVCSLTEQPHVHTEACYQTNLLCTLPETEGHTHDDSCYARLQICTLEEEAGHQHTDACYEQLTQLTCGLEECLEPVEPVLICSQAEIRCHTHSDSCYETYTDENGQTQTVLICTEPEILEHVHCESCYATREPSEDPDALTCTLAENHVHDDNCYDETGTLICTEPEGHVHTDRCYGTWVLTCELPEHTHTPECYPDTDYYCGLEEHTHGEGCYDEEGNLICELPVHTHSEDCLTETVTYYCGLEEHTHGDGCYDEAGNLICELPEHTHTEECKIEKPTYYCGLEEHTHGEGCYDEEGNLTCELTEHTHNVLCTVDLSSLSEEDRAVVEKVILLIEALPTPEEIEAKLMAYEEAGDLDGQDAYYLEVETHVRDVYAQYCALTTDQRALVPNLEKLLALEYMWGNQEEMALYYSSTIQGYNLGANNYYPIDAILGQEAGIDGKYTATTNLGIIQNASVMFVELVDWAAPSTQTCNIGQYFLGSDFNNLAKTGVAEGPLGMNLSEWYAVRVEECTAPEYPGFSVTGVYGLDATADDWGTMAWVANYTQDGFIIMLRKTYVDEKNGYLPKNGDLVHLNQEALQGEESRKFRQVAGFRPLDGWYSGSSHGPFGYVTFSPASSYGTAEARSDDRSVVSDIDFKLFDYSNYINKTCRSNDDYTDTGDLRIHNHFRDIAQYFYFRGGIDPHDDRDYSLDVSMYTPNVNTAAQDGIGHSTYDQDGFTPNHARVEPNLYEGYPVLDFSVDAKGNSISAPTGYGPNDDKEYRSLAYLFDGAIAKSLDYDNAESNPLDLAYQAVTQYNPSNTILQFDESSHTYWYDSALNAVDYDASANMFRVRPYTERTSITADWPFANASESGDFLPFNYSDGIVNATYHSGGTWGEYPLDDSSFRMNDVNYWFGMSMEFSFIQGEDGTVTYTNSSGARKTDVMKFEFSGDDDVWVFVDGVRILDLGGTHGSVTGTINFQTGVVTQQLDWGETIYSYPTTLNKCFELAGKNPNGGWDNDGTGTPGNRFADYSVHTLKFFYLERGTAVANCSIKFNLPNFDDPLVVGKTLKAHDESVDQEVLEYLQENTEYSYRALKSDADGNPTGELFFTQGQTYTLLDNGLNVGTRKVGENGIFKLKHGQQAVFEDILAIAGYQDVNFVIEEILPKCQNGHYNSVQYSLDADVGTMVGKQDDTMKDFIGYYSPVLSSGEPKQIQYHNTVKTDTLSVLKVSKEILEGSEFVKGQTFTIRVKLDGEYLASGTKYSIDGTDDGTEYDVGENGAITLTGGQTAEILVPVLAGTTFAVEEDPMDGCVVTYSSVTTAADGTQSTGTGSGSFPLDGTVHVTVSNATYSSRVPLTFTKQTVGNSETAAFTFKITQVDADGNEVAEDSTAGTWEGSPTITVTGDTAVSGTVYFTYGPTVPSGTYYYRLTEEVSGGWVCDDSVYIVAIEVQQGSAEIISVTKNGQDYGLSAAPVFTNYKDTQITVDKRVTGNFTEADKTKEFSFTAVVTLDGRQIVPSGGTGYTVASDGKVTFTLTHGKSVAIKGIPYGARVTVTEAEAPGFMTHYTLNDSAQKFSGSTAANVETSQKIHFVNTGGYELPDTGGAGTTSYTLAGLILSLLGTACLLYRTKARRRGGC